VIRSVRHVVGSGEDANGDGRQRPMTDAASSTTRKGYGLRFGLIVGLAGMAITVLLCVIAVLFAFWYQGGVTFPGEHRVRFRNTTSANLEIKKCRASCAAFEWERTVYAEDQIITGGEGMPYWILVVKGDDSVVGCIFVEQDGSDYTTTVDLSETAPCPNDDSE
jgi:hypothetical protein